MLWLFSGDIDGISWENLLPSNGCQSCSKISKHCDVWKDQSRSNRNKLTIGNKHITHPRNPPNMWKLVIGVAADGQHVGHFSVLLISSACLSHIFHCVLDPAPPTTAIQALLRLLRDNNLSLRREVRGSESPNVDSRPQNTLAPDFDILMAEILWPVEIDIVYRFSGFCTCQVAICLMLESSESSEHIW